MGTDSPVAPGPASKNQPSCSPRPTKTYSKAQPKAPNSNTSNKTHSKLSNKMGGTVASKHSLNQLHTKSKSPSHNSTRRTVPNKKLSTKKVRSNLNKLNIIQCNLHKAKSAWDSIASSFSDIKHPIFITTEPYHDRNRVIPSVHKDLVHYYYNQGPNGPRACISVNKSLNGACWEIKEFTSRDCIAIKIIINNKPIILASIYMDVEDKDFPPKSVTELTKYATKTNTPLIVGSDTNSHHTIWGDKKQDKRAEILLEYLGNSGLSWANKGTKPTYINSRGHSSVIDLTITNNKATDLIKNWYVSDRESNSDHRYIMFNLEMDKKQSKITYNPNKTDWVKFEEYIDKSSRYKYLNQIQLVNESDMDNLAQELITLLNEALVASCPPSYTSSTLKRPPWMTREVDDARANIQHQLKRARKSKLTKDWNNYQLNLRDYKKILNKSKSNSWKEFCKNAESARETSRVSKILKSIGTKPTQLESIYNNKETKSLTNSPEETLDVMIKHHFTSDSDNEDIEQNNNQPTDKTTPNKLTKELINKIISEDRLGKVITSLNPLKAAGPDNIQNVLIQNAYNYIKYPLLKLYKQSHITGYIPKAWRETKGIFLPKPGKVDYNDAKSYRTITLSSNFLKIHKCLILWFMEHDLGLDNTLNKNNTVFGRDARPKLHFTK